MNATKKFILIFLTLLSTAVFAGLLVQHVFAPKTIASGCFHQVAHKGSGCAVIVQKSNGQTALQLTDFKTAADDDLQILLISSTDALENETVKNSERFYVAPLQKSEGFQEYVVPMGQNLTKFNAVTIWSSKHGVNFTTAPLKRF